MMNPFDDLFKDGYVFGLSNGKQLIESIANDLLTIKEKSKTWRKESETKCFAEPECLELAIPCRKVKNFAAQALNVNLTSRNLNVKEIKATRDVFGRLLYLSTIQKLDMLKVLLYSLTPVPLSLAYVDG